LNENLYRIEFFLGFDNVLIIVSLTGIYLYSIFSAFALLNNQNSATWIAYVKIVIVILGIEELNGLNQYLICSRIY